MPPRKKFNPVITAAPTFSPATAASALSNAPHLERSGVLAQTRTLIQRATGQKAILADYSTHPFVPSGSTIVDYLIGGQLASDGKGAICPGLPRKRIVEIYGPESSGKTTFALASIVRIQKMGGVAMFLDFEHALHFGYARAIGVDFDPDKLAFFQPDTLEEGLRMIFIGMRSGVDLIVVDSVAAMVPKAEMGKKLGDTARVGAVARTLSESLPKLVVWLTKPIDNRPDFEGTSLVFLNQTRANIDTNNGKGDKENTAGGKALKFYAYLRLRLSRIRSDYVERKDPFTGKKRRYPYSNVTNVKVVKNKVSGTQGHSGEIYIRYGFGLDDYMSLIEAACTRGIIKRNGSSYDYRGESFRGRDALRQMLLERQDVTDAIRAAVREAILADAQPLEIEEDDPTVILSDMREGLGDDDLVDSDDEEEYDEEVPADEDIPEEEE